MYKHLLFILLFLVSIAVNAQVKLGFRSGAGPYLDLGHLNLLVPSDDNTYVTTTHSEFGNPLPRTNDKGKVYVDFAHEHEFSLSTTKSIYKFGVGFVRRPRAYNDMLELFWGQMENQRLVHYTLTYGRQIYQRKKWSIDLNSGLIVDKFYVTRTSYSYSMDSQGNITLGNLEIHTIGRDPGQYDWGVPLETNINFNISPNASIGLQTKVFYLFQIGIEGAYLLPMIKVSF